MGRNFTYMFACLVIIAPAIIANYAFAAHPKTAKRDTINYYLNSKKNKAKKSPLTFSLPPFKPNVTSSLKVNIIHPDDKLLSNVEVYPNPITDQINLKYVVSHASNVNIKMTDVLGNEVVTLFSSHWVEPGEQTFTYPVTNKFSKGFYFIRVVAGTEQVIKRISIL